MAKTLDNASVERVCTALVTILQARVLLLEGIKMARQAKRYEKRHDSIKSLTKSIHAEACLVSAGAVMTATFGPDGELRQSADKALIGIMKKDVHKTP